LAGKPLALGGLHPYNPHTGIMLSRGISTGGPQFRDPPVLVAEMPVAFK
jgi:hypothetical protein